MCMHGMCASPMHGHIIIIIVLKRIPLLVHAAVWTCLENTPSRRSLHFLSREPGSGGSNTLIAHLPSVTQKQMLSANNAPCPGDHTLAPAYPSQPIKLLSLVGHVPL